MEILIVVLLAAVVVLQIVLLTVGMKREKTDIAQTVREEGQYILTAAQNSVKAMGELISSNQKNTDELQLRKLEEANKRMNERMEELNRLLSESFNRNEVRFKTYEATSEQKLEAIRGTVEKKLSDLGEQNAIKLEEMRKTVDEKLQKTLEEKMNQSFKLVSERLEQVYKGLGEMQTLAVGVGDLKKVLSNVKTRGILGEIQLGAILKEILSPEQYEENIATVPSSKNVVEFAIKIPSSNGEYVYLPIDSKFPQDAYSCLQQAYDSGSTEVIKAASKELTARIKQFAKDIHTKYIEVPYTTDFAVMFLPTEGLYAEVVNTPGLIDALQREYRVNVAGPSTMAALLNSIQMGFKTLAVQKRSQEVWKILSGVKTEFDKFAGVIEAVQQRINQANKELDSLVGTRTRAIQRQLRSVENINDLPESTDN
jgi:DNA recombination protein RmuC